MQFKSTSLQISIFCLFLTNVMISSKTNIFSQLNDLIKLPHVRCTVSSKAKCFTISAWERLFYNISPLEIIFRKIFKCAQIFSINFNYPGIKNNTCIMFSFSTDAGGLQLLVDQDGTYALRWQTVVNYI